VLFTQCFDILRLISETTDNRKITYSGQQIV